MRVSPDPERTPDTDSDPEAGEPREPTVYTVPGGLRPEERDRVTRGLVTAITVTGFGGLLALGALAGAAGRAWVPVGLSGLLALLAVMWVLHLVRVRVVRSRPAPPPASRIRVVRPGDRPVVRPEESAEGWPEERPELIPGARPVPPSTVLGGRVTRGDRSWPAARDRFARLRSEYAAFECDPMRVLRLPALADVSVPSTARFVDAFADAQSLATDTHPGAEHAHRFVTAAEHAARSWSAAREAAERIRLSGLTPAERTAVERVIKLLTTARDSDSEPERLAAYARARNELLKLDRAGVVHVPLPAQAAIAEAGRGQLPG